ncbi:GPI inositol-deacylase [Mycena indigotica]|uniref:GPI inositol-deacylase n=1 Tax=Mycena indigotica TaxID=2126181 RepID=A0A8H6W1Z7_9AGAR|nr:GPI inositol-deacylase [Mycena indigotica]KAF7302057.1 GPI inositol-deacylase [Mycena indigotica]
MPSYLFPSLAGFLAFFSLLSVVGFHVATLNVVDQLSPQGCRMSYMWESYVPQSRFDGTWTSLANRYSLQLYREHDGQGNHWGSDALKSLPVLFIPGNAGSWRQVRSIASSAARQYYHAPSSAAPEFRDRIRPLDFYAVEFNEDLSAFHGPTIEAQITYTARAIDYILSLYPPGTQIIVMGHSMGGVVATSLLSPEYNHTGNISTIITMSTPHKLPPARLDARIDAIYDLTRKVLALDPTPIVSLCGGATDLMIPSESCVLPESTSFRRTVFSSALEGAWTGVGHREMVWCHQVRWRIARAALEIDSASTSEMRALVLDRWLRDGHALPPLPHSTTAIPTNAEFLPVDMPLVLRNPHGEQTYLLPVPAASSTKFVILLSQGSIQPVSPQNPISLSASVFSCSGTTKDSLRCSEQPPSVLKLLPSPILGGPFPIPKEGSDESEGVVLFEADIDPNSSWVGVKMENGRGEGWIVGDFVPDEPVVNDVRTLQLFFGKVSISMPKSETYRSSFEFPNLLSNALVVYRVTPHHSALDQRCDPLFPPLLQHTSQPSETHYFPLLVPPERKILLHTHASAPHVQTHNVSAFGIKFAMYSSGPTGCLSPITTFDLSIDWSATFGRWASRYYTILPVWATGIVAWILFHAWGTSEAGAPVPTLEDSISIFLRKPLRRLLLLSALVSLCPLPEAFYLGNRGEPYFTAVAPLLVLISTGFVCTTWYLLRLLLWPLSKLGRLGRRDTTVHRSTVISMIFILLLIFLFVPWQVAFLGCWAIHLYNCAISQAHVRHFASIPDAVAIPLLRRDGEPQSVTPSHRPVAPPPPFVAGNHNHSMHILLFMTWLLPLAAPVLVVWVRTLAGAGLTTPFDGDHFVLSAAPFLVLVDFASWVGGPLFEKQRFERPMSVRWAFACVSGVSFLLGSRKPYLVFDLAKVAIGLVVVVRIGPRYWGRSSWAPV